MAVRARGSAAGACGDARPSRTRPAPRRIPPAHAAAAGAHRASAAAPPPPPPGLLSQASKYEVKPRNIQFHIVKKDGETWWPRLLKDKAKEKNQVAIDWSRYVDEDEAEGGFDMSQFGAGASVSARGAGRVCVCGGCRDTAPHPLGPSPLRFAFLLPSAGLRRRG